MSTPMVVTRTQARTRLPILRRIMIAGLVGNVLVFTAQQIVMRTLIPPLAVILALTLVVAAVCATRWRWAALVAVVWCVLSVIPGLEPYTYSLTHPTEIVTFIATSLGLGLLLVAVVAGVAELISGYRTREANSTPRWLQGFLIGMATFVFGAIVVALITPSDATAGVSPEALAALPGLTTENYQFEQREIRAKVGATVVLRLDNADSSTHFLDIDEFNVHAPMPAGKSNVAIFTPTQPGTYTFYCAPHSNKATGEGMVGKLIVAP